MKRNPIYPRYRLRFFLSILVLQTVLSLTLKTTTKVRGVSRREVQDFLATPTNWPKIVASSQSVKATSNPIDIPLQVGQEVTELFGLPTILSWRMSWTCEENEPVKLDFCPPKGSLT